MAAGRVPAHEARTQPSPHKRYVMAYADASNERGKPQLLA